MIPGTNDQINLNKNKHVTEINACMIRKSTET